MDLFSRLKVGDRLNIERYKKDIVLDEKGILSAQLMDIDLHKKEIYISAPIYKGKRYFLSNGQNIGIFFYRDTAVYQFYAKVLKQVDINIIAFVVKPENGLYRIQRRKHYRLPVVIKVTIEQRRSGRIHKLECVTKDLSGGGIKAICNEKLEEGEDVGVRLYLGKNNIIIVNGKIMRVVKDTTTNCYGLGIKFDKISQINEDNIYAFIFRRQRLLLKKGLM
ncbi:MAG TPA: PilZ domain-containing protein [Clostridia bacterium]|nr:PilZ domain-containing protein [Clostridia bacterium]